MSKKSIDRHVKAAADLTVSIIFNFILIPIVVATIIVVVLSGNFWLAFIGALIGSVSYGFAFDREFKYNLKLTLRRFLISRCHNFEDRKRLIDAFNLEDLFTETRKTKEPDEKERLNKSILDD